MLKVPKKVTKRGSGRSVGSNASGFHSSQEEWTHELEPTGDEDDSSSEDEGDDNYLSKQPGFQRLPENVQNAMITARRKQKHSDFYNKLKHLNEKIEVYKSVFYKSRPKYERIFQNKKTLILEAEMRT